MTARAGLVVLTLLALCVPVAGWAATATVTTCTMGGAGSLDTLIAAAGEGDTINFGLDCSGGSAILFTSNIVIKDKGLTIDGTGHTIELDGGWAGLYDGPNGFPSGGSSLFSIFTNGTEPYTVNFIHLTMKNGNGFANGGPSGAINNTRDIINITGCTFTGNVGNLGGALFVQNGSTINVVDSTLTGNENPAIGGFNTGSGGAVYAAGIFNATNSTFYDNHITGTANGTGGAIAGFSGTVTLTACTISGNSAGNGGGISAPSTVKNSILYGNTATNGPDAFGGHTSDGTNLIGVAATGFGGTDSSASIRFSAASAATAGRLRPSRCSRAPQPSTRSRTGTV